MISDKQQIKDYLYRKSFNDKLYTTNKPCPDDFPLRLRKYWKNNLEHSLTPLQCGWIQYYKDVNDIKKKNVNDNKKKY